MIRGHFLRPYGSPRSATRREPRAIYHAKVRPGELSGLDTLPNKNMALRVFAIFPKGQVTLLSFDQPDDTMNDYRKDGWAFPVPVGYEARQTACHDAPL